VAIAVGGFFLKMNIMLKKTAVSSGTKAAILFGVIFLLSLFIRLPHLAERPMHSDEAINGFKYGELLESGRYIYDPREYHGPALYYFTLPLSLFSGHSNLRELTETELRLEPVLMFLFLLSSLLIIRRELGWNTLLIAAGLLAVSPAMVYYSRYYIHEITLVAFLYHALFWLYRYLREQKLHQLLFAAWFWGLAISAKETWLVAAALSLPAASVVLFMEKKAPASVAARLAQPAASAGKARFWHWGLALMLILLVAALFYSSFLGWRPGLKDACTAYSNYFNRAVESSVHIQPWYFYLERLLWFNTEEGNAWSEGAILIPAALFFLILNRKSHRAKSLSGFLAVLSFGMLAVFSLIPYKTTWNLLTFWPGIVILAAAAIEFLWLKMKNRRRQIIFAGFLISVFIQLAWQSYQLNYAYPASPQNPYVYAHPTPDVVKLAEQIVKIAEAQPSGFRIHTAIPEHDYWPLPWYLRSLKTTAWSVDIDSSIIAASIIVIAPEDEDRLLHFLYEIPPPGQRNLYIPLIDSVCWLRPGKEICAYARKDALDCIP
jgi:uncharacterized protein (TIGR03663 family)